jgi:putative MFS transporter
VQGWIDERPQWPDGTRLPSVPMTGMQWLIWSLAAAGKFFEGFVVFMTGVALPLFSEEFHLGSAEHGIIGAASLFGILIGAVTLGGMSDKFGRKIMFIVEMVIFCVFLVALVFAPNYALIVVCLFAIGLALGGKLVLGAFAFQAIGALAGTAVGYGVLSTLPELSAWRWMYAIAVIPAVLVTVGRFYIVESANWLAARGDVRQAEDAVRRLLRRNPQYPSDIKLAARTGESEHGHGGGNTSFAALFNKANRRATILASVPWFLQDLGTYGIGIFTPTILAASVGASHDHSRSMIDIIHNDIVAAEGSALITALLIVGIAFAVVLADVVGRIRLQVLGFVGCAIGLVIASMSSFAEGGARTLLIFAGFMLFNFMTNLGPNAQTYLLAGEVFPTAIRGKGAGFAAAFAKVGAVLTAFLFPILLSAVGTSALLYGLVVTSLLGAVVTWVYRIETNGVDLDALDTDVPAETARAA